MKTQTQKEETWNRSCTPVSDQSCHQGPPSTPYVPRFGRSTGSNLLDRVSTTPDFVGSTRRLDTVIYEHSATQTPGIQCVVMRWSSIVYVHICTSK